MIATQFLENYIPSPCMQRPPTLPSGTTIQVVFPKGTDPGTLSFRGITIEPRG
jgi:hypothetical protein